MYWLPWWYATADKSASSKLDDLPLRHMLDMFQNVSIVENSCAVAELTKLSPVVNSSIKATFLQHQPSVGPEPCSSLATFSQGICQTEPWYWAETEHDRLLWSSGPSSLVESCYDNQPHPLPPQEKVLAERRSYVTLAA